MTFWAFFVEVIHEYVQEGLAVLIADPDLGAFNALLIGGHHREQGPARSALLDLTVGRGTIERFELQRKGSLSRLEDENRAEGTELVLTELTLLSLLLGPGERGTQLVSHRLAVGAELDVANLRIPAPASRGEITTLDVSAHQKMRVCLSPVCHR